MNLASTPADPIADLIERIRHPIRWSLKHPIRAIARYVALATPRQAEHKRE